MANMPVKRIKKSLPAARRKVRRSLAALRAAAEASGGLSSQGCKLNVDDEELGEHVLARHIEILRRLDPEEFAVINTNIPSAVSQAFGVAPKLTALLPALRELPGFDIELVANLADWAIILNDAHAGFLARSAPVRAPAALLAEARAMRKTLHADALRLAERGILSSKALDALAGPVGYANLGNDLRLLAKVFSVNQDAVRNKCAVSQADLTRAESLADQLLELTTQAAEPNDAQELRLRAFTLFARAYAEARAGVWFLRRREGDVDLIIPPLNRGRPKRSHGSRAVTD